MRYSFFLVVSFLFFFLKNSYSQNYSPIQTGPRLVFDVIFPKAETLIVEDALGIDSISINSKKNELDFGLGMFMQFNIKEYLFLRPEAIVHISNRDMSILNLANNTTEDLNHRLYSFSLPIQLGYQVEGISLQTGIVWHNQLRTDLIKSDKEDFNYEFGNGYTSFTVGLGYKSKGFLFDIYYESAMGKLENVIAINDIEYRQQMNPKQLSIRIGFILSGRD